MMKNFQNNFKGNLIFKAKKDEVYSKTSSLSYLFTYLVPKILSPASPKPGTI